MKKVIQSVGTVCGVLVILSQGAIGQKVPAVLGKYLTSGVAARGQVVVVEPPKEISEYVKKVEKAALADPEWFKTYSKNARPGVPLPFHEKLGLTKEDGDVLQCV